MHLAALYYALVFCQFE